MKTKFKLVLKSYRAGVIIRLLLLLILMGMAVVFILLQHQYITGTITAMAMLVAVAELFVYTDRANRRLARFLSNIQYHDFNTKVTDTGSGQSWQELSQAMNLITKHFSELSAEKEIQYHYLQAVVNHTQTGLLAFDEEGEMHLFNPAASALLNVPYLKNIRGIVRKHPSLYHEIEQLVPGIKKTISIDNGVEKQQLSIQASAIVLKDKRLTVISLQNISAELSAAETEAWQKLMRVLMHEIMNSLTPITSISSSLLKLVEDETDADVKLGLQTIAGRSQGLLHFVEAYRTLAREPQPQIKEVFVSQLVERVILLMGKTAEAAGISLQQEISDTSLTILADDELLEQVLINLVLNAIDATRGKQEGNIIISAGRENGRNFITVADNGKGMDVETMDKVFVPFYTTKASGSGIGLSLSRQIMKLHQGELTCRSAVGKGTIFMLHFPKMIS